MHDADPPRTARAVAEVLAARTLTPHMRRITLGGAGLAPFLLMDGIDAPAAWVKVFPPCGTGRAYTVRHIDRAAGTLDLDFVLHGHGPASGPASAWAAQARMGEHVGIAGPRSGGFALPADARWVLLAGDATALPALPALQRIAGALPAQVQAKAYAEVPEAADQQPIDSPARLRTEWFTQRQSPGLALCQALLHRPLPPGPGYLWMAGESRAMRALRQHYLQERGLEPRRVHAQGYWKAGEADHRDG